MESLRLGSSRTSASISEVLPAPEGAVMTKSRPLRLLNVLHLLADLLHQQLELQRAVRDRLAGSLGGEGVGLAVELLGDEVEPLADGASRAERSLHFVKMQAQPLELLGDV